MRDTRVFVDLAEQVLNVDELKRSSGEGSELQATACKLLLLPVCDGIHGGRCADEASRQSALGARTGDTECILLEAQCGAIAKVGEPLVGEKGSNEGLHPKELDRFVSAPCRNHSLYQAFFAALV